MSFYLSLWKLLALLNFVSIKTYTIEILDIVISNEFDSVSIPEISTEANNIPINLSAPIICKTIKSFINSNREEMKGKTIVLCCPHRLSVSQSGYLI